MWALLGGGKDDIFIYDKSGALHTYLKHGGDVDTNLSTEDGATNLRNAILNAMGE